MIKKSNTVSFFCDNQCVFTHNEMLNFIPFLSGERYSKNISVGRGAGLSNNKMDAVATKETTLSEYNIDSAQGAVYAVYLATFTDEDILPGEKISEAGLCRDSNSEMANYALLSPVEKIAGKDLTVKIEIRLYLEGDTAFVSGDNELVKILLGIEDGEGATFEIARGDNYHPVSAMAKSEPPLERASASVTLTNNSISFSGNLTLPGYELLLYCNGKPSLRCYNYQGVSAEYFGGAVGEEKSIDYYADHIKQVSGVQLNGSYLPNYTIANIPSRLTEDCSLKLPQRLPDEYEVISEHKGNYIGVYAGKEISVFNLLNEKLMLAYKTDAIDKTPVLVSNGALFLYGADGVEFITSAGVKRKLSINADELCAVDTSGSYLLVARVGEVVSIYKCSSSGALTLKETLKVGSDFTMSRANAYYIAFMSPSLSIYRCVGLNNEFSKVANTLRQCAENFSDIYLDGSFIRMKNGNENIMVHLLGDEVIPYDEDYIFCDSFLRTSGGKTSAVSVCFGTKKAERLLNFATEIPKFFTFMGGYLLFFYGESVRTFYPIPCGKTIFSPNLVKGDTVTFTVSKGKEIAVGAAGVRQTLTLTTGG